MPKEFPLPAPQKQILGWPLKENATLSISFGRPLNGDRWKAAWEFLLQRHPILRSSYSQNSQSLFEHDSVLPNWVELDWTALSPEEIGRSWQELQAQELVHEFKHGTYPLWRLHILQLPNGTSHFLWTVHHSLFDEKSAGDLLVEWFTLYGADIDFVPPPSPTLSTAFGSMDIHEDQSVVDAALKDLSETIFDPFAFLADPGDAEQKEQRWGVVHIDLSPDFSPEWDALSKDNDAALPDLLTVLWGGFLARLNVGGESLTAASVDLHAQLAPEHEGVLGRMEVRVPLRLSEPPSDAPQKWLQDSLLLLQKASACVFLDWQNTVSSFAKKLGFPPNRPIPLSEVLWQNASIVNQLHTAHPRWLGADARWQEPFICPVTLRGCPGAPGRGLRLELHHRHDVLDATAARWLIDEFAFFVSSLLETGSLRLRDEIERPVEPQDPFVLQGEPDLSVLLSDHLRTSRSPALFQPAETNALSAAEAFRYSNQILRFLRHAKQKSEAVYLVCMSRSAWLSLTLLALVRDKSNFLLLTDSEIPENLDAFCEKHNIKCLLLDSSTEDAFASIEIRKTVIDASWGKIAEQQDTEASPRKLSAPCSWKFLPEVGGEPVALGESIFTSSILFAIKNYNLGPQARLLSTAPLGTPSFLEETLVCVLSDATLVHPKGNIFSTRSTFQEELENAQITHIFLPAGRWSDWVHFLVELGKSVPSSLRQIHLHAGRVGDRVRKEWNRLANGAVQTFICQPMFGLHGVGWQGSFFGESEGAVPMGIPLGKLAGPGRALCLDSKSLPLPVGFSGKLFYELPETALGDKKLAGRRDTGMSGFAARNGCWYSLHAPDWPPSPSAAPFRRIIQQAETALCLHPEIMDAFVEVLPDSGNIRAWVIPLDSNGGVPKNLGKYFAQHGPTGWELVAAAPLQKYPLDVFGSILVAELPAPQSLAAEATRLTAGKPQEKSVSSQGGATVPNPQPAKRAAIRFLSEPAPEKTVAIFFGPTVHPGVIKLFAEQTGDIYAVGAFPFAVADPSACSFFLEELKRLPSVSPLLLLAQGNDVWVATKLIPPIQRETGNSPQCVFLAPKIRATPEKNAFFGSIKSFFNKVLAKPVSTNTRRDEADGERPVRCQERVSVIFDGDVPEDAAELFPLGEFYDADLDTEETIVGAILDVLGEASSEVDSGEELPS